MQQINKNYCKCGREIKKNTYPPTRICVDCVINSDCNCFQELMDEETSGGN